MLLILFIYLIDGISSQTLSTCNWCKFLQYYPKQYNTSKLQLNESIIIDGYLNESAWIDVEFTNTSFVDIAISLYNNTTNGYNIPNNYSTKVKLRWDNNYLYIGAILNEPFIYGTIIGHNNATSGVPYFDHDFEIFIDPSGTNYFYKEFEINVLNATFDVLHHKPSTIPCNSSFYGNESYLFNSTTWCLDTTWNNHGNWTMYSSMDTTGLKTATSIQYRNIINNTNTCIAPCDNCPDSTPLAWCPWSYLTTKCNTWPQILQYKSWTIEIAMPLRYNENHGGILDTDNITLNMDFINNYNPNSFDDLDTHKLYWWIDFARTEHPMGFNSDNKWSVVSNKSVLSQVMNIYPTLLGIYQWSDYWEWTWQSVGITKYMHYPQYWGMLQFYTDKSQICLNIEWPGRYLIYSIWWANYEYFNYYNGTKYATNINELINSKYCLNGYCDLKALTNAQFANDSCFMFDIGIDSNKGCVNVLKNNNMTLIDKLYSGICYHATVNVKVNDCPDYDYSITITESHQVSVQRQQYDLCLDKLIFN